MRVEIGSLIESLWIEYHPLHFPSTSLLAKHLTTRCLHPSPGEKNLKLKLKFYKKCEWTYWEDKISRLGLWYAAVNPLSLTLRDSSEAQVAAFPLTKAKPATVKNTQPSNTRLLSRLIASFLNNLNHQTVERSLKHERKRPR